MRVARTRQVLLVKLLKVEDDQAASDTMLNAVSLGTSRQLVRSLERFNTGPDGSKSPEGASTLYGPGLIIQLPMVGPDDPVMQVAASMVEEDIAWPVLMRICRGMGWKMMDPASGRTFGAG